MRLKKILTLISLVSGILITVYGGIRIKNAYHCRDWDKVQGEVIGSMVAELPNSSKNRNTASWVPDIVYEYNYKGQTYFSQSISYVSGSSGGLHDSYYADTEDHVAAFVEKYPVGTPVTVYVNPEEPEVAVIDPSIKLPHFIPLILGLLLIYIAFHLYVFSSHYMKKHDTIQEEAS